MQDRKLAKEYRPNYVRFAVVLVVLAALGWYLFTCLLDGAAKGPLVAACMWTCVGAWFGAVAGTAVIAAGYGTLRPRPHPDRLAALIFFVLALAVTAFVVVAYVALTLRGENAVAR